MELAPLALLAGIISITAPCALPLIPGYVSYITGLSAGQASNRRIIGSSLLFVAGFSTVFTVLGASASLLGAFLLDWLPQLLKVAGAVVIVMGVSMLGFIRIPMLQAEKRMDLRKVRPGPLGALPLGMAFAFGWTPCIGPILGTILTAAAATQTALEGAALLAIYSLGMGIPFVLIAFGVYKSGRLSAFFRRHALKIERAGGVLLVAMGVLLVTGAWTRLFAPLLRWFARVGWPPL